MGLFDKIKLQRPKMNKFDLSHERKFSCPMGDLIPILVQDIVPGDKFKVNTEIMMRFAPMLAPIMHRVNVYTHYFFVPNRLVYNEWEDFITGGEDGMDISVPPYFTVNTANNINFRFNQGGLFDFMGMPVVDNATTITDHYQCSLLPFRAYQMIYNEYFRDQNLTSPVQFSLAGGEVTDSTELDALLAIRLRCWEKDYLTSCLPWAQRGDQVLVPMEAQAAITYKDPAQYYVTGGTSNPDPGTTKFGSSHTLQDVNSHTTRVENINSIDVTNTSITINDLRRSIRLQEWLEKNARGGARYIEQILSHFGVVSSDARLQRPEYLGGGKQPAVISEVLSTFQDPSGDGNPLATMAGHGISVGNSNGFHKRFEEHGYVIGLMSVLPRTAYQQGIPRSMRRFDKFDYYWPEFANIGEQAVLNGEAAWFKSATLGTADQVFGYQSRYAEYKYQPSTVHGAFKDSLSFWHMGRIFSSLPALNTSFVTADPTKRIFAVEDSNDNLLVQLYNKVDALRPMPYFGTPIL